MKQETDVINVFSVNILFGTLEAIRGYLQLTLQEGITVLGICVKAKNNHCRCYLSCQHSQFVFSWSFLLLSIPSSKDPSLCGSGREFQLCPGTLYPSAVLIKVYQVVFYSQTSDGITPCFDKAKINEMKNQLKNANAHRIYTSHKLYQMQICHLKYRLSWFSPLTVSPE